MAAKDAVPVLNGELLVEKDSVPDAAQAEIHEFTKDAPAVNRDPIKCDVLVGMCLCV